MIKIVGRREILDILVMFLIVQLLGLLLATTIFSTSVLQKIRTEITSQQIALLSYSLDILLVAIVALLLLNRHRHHYNQLEDNILFVSLEAVVVIATSFFFFLAVFNIIIPQYGWQTIFFASLVCAVALITIKDLDPQIRNVATMLSSIGVGLLLGIYLNFGYALIALALVAIYDYAAVTITKVMVRVARAITARDLAFVISASHVEAVPMGGLNPRDVKNYERYLHRTREDREPEFRSILQRGELPVISQIQLGEGDLGLPLMATVSAYYSFSNLLIAMYIILGSVFGLLVVMIMLKRYKMALPAIPPLFTFIGLFSWIAILVTGTSVFYTSLYLVLVGILILFAMIMRLSGEAKRRVKGSGLSR